MGSLTRLSKGDTLFDLVWEKWGVPSRKGDTLFAKGDTL